MFHFQQRKKKQIYWLVAQNNIQFAVEFIFILLWHTDTPMSILIPFGLDSSREICKCFWVLQQCEI